MSNLVRVSIHPSQFPDAVHGELRASLVDRRMNHKFHYDTPGRARRWLAVHEAHSPARTDPDCQATYGLAFSAAAAALGETDVQLIGLGCGGGQKDAQLLRELARNSRRCSYVPLDVSPTLVLVAREAARQVISEDAIHPCVADLAVADDLGGILETLGCTDRPRLFSFFGMIPNFEPAVILPRLAALLRADDWLLFSANLAPGADYAAGVTQMLPQYDNAETRRWLWTVMEDHGAGLEERKLHFAVEPDPVDADLLRLAAHWEVTRDATLVLEREKFPIAAGERFRLFFSYRYTPATVKRLLARNGLRVVEAVATTSGEEGVFLCRRT